MSSWTELLHNAGPAEHLVQLYGDDEPHLTRNVSRYFAQGLSRGDGLLLLATPEHTESILGQLSREAPVAARAVADGRLVCLDAETTLERFTVRGQPDRALFRSIVSEALEGVQRQASSGHVRAFGEMVGLLWTRGQLAEATLLEGYWNELLEEVAFSLFCAYPIDLFAEQYPKNDLTAVLGCHTHLCAGEKTVLSKARAIA